MLSVGAIRFEDRFCASKKSGLGGGGRVSARSAVHMAVGFDGYRKALVGTGLSISDCRLCVYNIMKNRGNMLETIEQTSPPYFCLKIV